MKDFYLELDVCRRSMHDFALFDLKQKEPQIK